MKKLRVTKYNPEFRGETGIYLKEDWTSYSDIGEFFSGKRLSLEDYIEVEKKYINAISKLIQFKYPCNLTVSKLEKYSNISEFEANDDLDLISTYNKINNLYEFDGKDPILESLIKLTLREYMWLELDICDAPIKIIFGYDYYMYFSGMNFQEVICRQIEDLGLFVEEIPIP